MPLEPTFLAIQLLNGLQLASLLFLLSVGLSVVFGLMNFINLAHGTLYMVGAYIGLSLTRATGSFWVALVLAPVAVAALGAVFHLLLLRRIHAESPMKQVLVTFGLVFIGLDSVRYLWGNYNHALAPPELFAGGVSVLGETYPAYRLLIIALGLVLLFVILHLTGNSPGGPGLHTPP